MPTEKKVVVVKGTSATGKGTRIVQLIEYLKSQFNTKVIKVNKKGKPCDVGISFPELDLTFVGTVVKSNKSGLLSWSSMDYIHSTFGGADGARKVLDELFGSSSTLILEGEPMMLSNRWRPDYMIKELGVSDFLLVYMTYPEDERELYDQRIMERSGKKAGDSGWGRNSMYLKEIDKSIDELTTLGYRRSYTDPDFYNHTVDHDRWSGICSLNYDAPLETIGYRVLSFLGMGSFNAGFKAYTDENPMLRSIRGANPLSKSKRLW